MKILGRKIVVIVGVFVAFALAVSISASEVDQTGIQSVQTILNYWGYDCGTPDGIAGGQTEAAVKQYQHDQGIEETGEITYALISRMANGIPYNVFERRYNEMVDYLNSITSETKASVMNHIHIDTVSESYSPDGIFDLYVNPNYSDKAMIGSINIGNVERSSLAGTELATGLTEYYATIYAFDPALTSFNVALETAGRIIGDPGEYHYNSITYHNYSGSGMIAITGNYDAYVGVNGNNNQDQDGTTKAVLIKNNVEKISDFDALTDLFNADNVLEILENSFGSDLELTYTEGFYNTYSIVGMLSKSKGIFKFSLKDGILNSIRFDFDSLLVDDADKVLKTLIGISYVDEFKSPIMITHYWGVTNSFGKKLLIELSLNRASAILELDIHPYEG